MAENVNKTDAEAVLLSCFRSQCTVDNEISSKIKLILSAKHKTYKYILINALLAKATNDKINPLALQANAQIQGAYDARSLCHNVLVPFEREFLDNVLGGSNEPFLNKPARFPILSEQNAVRKGEDRRVLELLIEVLSFVNTKRQSDVQPYLSCSLEFLLIRAGENRSLRTSSNNYNPTLIEVYEFIHRFLTQSMEGETSVIIVGALEKIYYERQQEDYVVVTHKVNQSGASSKEVGDIDIYKNDNYYYSIEVKDKRFTEHDLSHAFTKIQSGGGLKGHFIYGPQGIFEKDNIMVAISSFEESGFIVLFQNIYSYSKSMIFKFDLKNKEEFIKTIYDVASEINAKDETFNWIKNLMEELNWR